MGLTCEEQEERLRIKAKGINAEYLGLAEEWIGQRTHIVMKCNTCNNIWNTGTVDNLVGKRQRTCPNCAKIKRALNRQKPDEHFIESFMKTGVFHPGTIFKRKHTMGRIWIIECPLCSDEIFESDKSNLQAGKLPCNCSSGSSGFDRTKESDFYILHIIGVTHSFIGFGISNQLETRLATHKRKLMREGFHIEQTYSFSMSGSDALRLENLIKKKFPLFPQSVPGFKTEATHVDNLNDMLYYVEEFIDNLGQDTPEKETQ